VGALRELSSALASLRDEFGNGGSSFLKRQVTGLALAVGLGGSTRRGGER
jgi:hypothetical protein